MPMEVRFGSARTVIGTVFLVNGAVFATWASRVPAVREALDLSPGALGLALLGLTGGAVVALPLSGTLVSRFGSLLVARAGLAAYCAALYLISLAPDLILLALALAVFGVGNSALDVSMNAQGVELERRRGRPVLGSLHALWSIGGFLGAASGAGAAAVGMSVSAHFALAGGVLLTLGLLATARMLPEPEDRQAGPAFARPTRKLVLLGVVAFCALLAEGVVNDWSAVYLREVAGANPGVAPLGFAAFSLTMAAGRLLTDKLVTRTGPGPFVRLSATVALMGLGLVLLVPLPAAGIAGFALLGAGLAGVLPVVFGLTGGREREGTAGPAIAAVSTLGYLGFLSGPVLIGALAELSDLRLALVSVVVLVFLMVVVAGTLGRHYPVAEDR